ncbi:hypothetical protein [Streptomyces parvulus]|uniref:hypothetical protein n=1 Tax=Streptomyces parvulus TaxID=146923 RepID=UPI00369BDDE3
MSDEPSEGHVALLAHSGMYAAALGAGVTLVLSGQSTITEASVFVSPFLMYMQKVAPVPAARTGRRRQADRQ